MQCERAQEMLSPYLDGELPTAEREAVATHLEECRACFAVVSDYRRTGRTIAAAGREPLPSGLAERVRASLERAEEGLRDQSAPVAAGLKARRPASAGQSYARQAAMIFAACLLTALATWWIAGVASQTDRVEQEVLSAHVRSLLQDSPIQVASSDAHTVKPWFAGRIDFAPEVRDLAAEGFPLLGGRLDYVAGRRVGAIVYKRRLHTISVFVWPATQGDIAARIVTRNGFNLLSWRRHGLAYWAVSDLNASDLGQLANLL